MTGLGAIFLPLCLYFWNTPARLLELVFIGSVFAAAAALVLGGYGVTPGLVPAALFIGYFVLKLVMGTRYPAEKLALGVLLPFILVVFGAIISSLLMPRLFQGDILVWPQKLSGFFVLTPLSPNSGNYTQDMYLLINALLTVTASLYLTRTGTDLRRLLDAYFISGLLVVFISLWQFAGNTFHVWFPADFFLSNPGWALLSNESLGSMIRVNGPFSEPSALAGYLCGSVCACAWVILNGDKARLPRALLVAGTGVLLLSTSTTGYAALVIMIMLLCLYTVIAGRPALRKRLITGAAGVGALLVVGIAIVPVVAPQVAEQVITVTNATLNKQQSSSYSDRTSTDRDSVHEMFESYGLGVGWGSNRSSSLLPGLCASVGIWGVVGLLWFALGIVRHIRTAHRLAPSPAPRLVMHACSGAILGTLAAALLSGPSITSPDFYLLLALLIATGARARRDAAAAGTAISRTTTRSPLAAYSRPPG